jgi:hypothetical protein
VIRAVNTIGAHSEQSIGVNRASSPNVVGPKAGVGPQSVTDVRAGSGR